MCLAPAGLGERLGFKSVEKEGFEFVREGLEAVIEGLEADRE